MPMSKTFYFRWKVKTDSENNKETHYRSEQDNTYVNSTLTETGNNVTGQYVNPLISNSPNGEKK
jgi:hypothetical protein